MELDLNHPLLKVFCYQYLIEWNHLGNYDFNGLEILKIEDGNSVGSFCCFFKTNDVDIRNGAQFFIDDSKFFDWLVEHRQKLIDDIL
jgi:hypothetical protein